MKKSSRTRRKMRRTTKMNTWMTTGKKTRRKIRRTTKMKTWMTTRKITRRTTKMETRRWEKTKGIAG